MDVTTIVAIVAIVLFLIICVIVLSSWKQGNKSRDGAIKAIEQSINDVVYELSEMNTSWKNTCDRLEELEKKREEEKKAAEIEKLVEKETYEEPVQGEISLDFADLEDFNTLSLSDLGFEEIELLDSMSDTYTEYNTGKSGKKYTAEELETLIKE